MSAKKLSAETRRDWRTACDREKRGGYDWRDQNKRAEKRAIEWAVWKLGKPEHWAEWASIEGGEVFFVNYTSGFLASVTLPEWAQPVRNADEWHAFYQAQGQRLALAAE